MPMVAVAIIAGAAAAGAAYAAGFAIATALLIGAAVMAASTLLVPTMDAFNASDPGQSITVRDQTGVIPVSYGSKIKSGVIESYSDVSSDGHTLIVMGTFGFGSIGGVSKIWVDNNPILIDECPILTTGVVSEEFIRKPHKDNVKIEIDTGSDSALSLPQQFGKITPSYKGQGLAKYCITIKRQLTDGELLNPSPNISFEIAGLKILDLTTGSVSSTSNGPSILLHYLCDPVFGYKVDPDDIDRDSFIDVAREVKALQLDTNGSIKPNDTPKQIISNICSSFGGVLIEAFGKYYLRRDRVEISKYTITDADIVGACDISNEQASSAKNTYNVKWADPNQNWTSTVTQVQDSAAVLRDGRIDDASLELPFSTDIDDVKYITGIELNKSKFLQKLQLRIAGLYDLMPMDVITINSETYSIHNKKYRISNILRGVAQDLIHVADYVLVEYDASIYSSDHSVVYNPDSVIDQSTQVLDVSNFECSSIGPSNTGYQYRLNWTLPQDPHRLGLRIRYREAGSTSQYTTITLSRDSTGTVLTVPNAGEYEIQIQSYGMITNSAWVGTTAVGGATGYTMPVCTGLKLLNHSALGSTFTDDLNFVFQWQYDKTQKVPGTDYTVQHYFDHYRITVNGVSYTSKTESFEYNFDLNRANGVSRTVTVQVQAVGLGSVVSDAIQVQCTNPQHLAPTNVDISVGWDSPTISWQGSNEPDRAGTVIEFWSTGANSVLVKSVHTSEITTVSPSIPGGTYRVRLAHYDQFGIDSLLYAGWFDLVQTNGIPSTALDLEVQHAIDTVQNIESISDSKIIDVFEHVEKVSRQINNVAGSVSAKVTDIASQFGDLKVKVQNLSNIVISSDGTSTADQIDLIELDLGNIKADVSSTKNLIVANDTAYSSKFDTINASLNNNSAAIQSVSQSLVTKDTATNTRIDSVSNIVGNNKTTYDNFVKAQTNTNTANTNALTQLSSRIGTAESLIQTIQNTNATQDSAISSLTTAVQAKYDDSISKINSLASTEAAHNLANATSLNQLSSRVGSAESIIQTLQTTNANQDYAISVLNTSVQAKYDDSISKINSLASTEAAHNSATATSLNQLSSRVGSTESAISTLSTTQASDRQTAANYTNQIRSELNGQIAIVNSTASTLVSQMGQVKSNYTLSVQADGTVAGYSVLVDGTLKTSAIGFQADKFTIATTGGKVTPFAVSGSNVYADNLIVRSSNIQNASIQNAHIQDASISSLKLAGTIQSDNYSSSAGWQINRAGSIIANNATIRGTIQADSGYFNGQVNASSGTFNNVTINNNCVINGALIQRNLTVGTGAISSIKKVYSVTKSNGWKLLDTITIDTGISVGAWWNADDKTYSASAGIDAGTVTVNATNSFGTFIANWGIVVNKMYVKSRWNGSSTIMLELAVYAEVDGNIFNIDFSNASTAWRVFKTT